MRDLQVQLSGGRVLAYTDIGAPDGTCAFFCHGAPMSRLHLGGLEGAFAARGLRVVTPDRPGYGGSSPQPGRSMADWPRDIAELADELGIERFFVAAHSSGGPYGVACGALLGDRVRGGALVAGVTDMAWAGAWDGYVESEIELMRVPDESAALAWCAERYGTDGAGFFSSSDLEMPEVDNLLLENEDTGGAVVAALSEAFRQGVVGYAQDIFVQGSPWPFDPATISAPVVVMHGEADTLLPMAHSRHTAELIPGATLRTFSGHGHLTILSELPIVLEELARAS